MKSSVSLYACVCVCAHAFMDTWVFVHACVCVLQGTEQHNEELGFCFRVCCLCRLQISCVSVNKCLLRLLCCWHWCVHMSGTGCVGLIQAALNSAMGQNDIVEAQISCVFWPKGLPSVLAVKAPSEGLQLYKRICPRAVQKTTGCLWTQRWSDDWTVKEVSSSTNFAPICSFFKTLS